MTGTHIQIQDNEYINLMVSPCVTMISFPLHSYNPYERMGKHMRDDIYAQCEYSIICKSQRDKDRMYVFHQRRQYNA